MSRLGGFNAVCQIRRDKLLDLAQEAMTVQGQGLITPLRLSREGPRDGDTPVARTVDVIVSAIDLRLDAGTNVGSLILHVEAGVIRLAGEQPAPVSGASIEVRLRFSDGPFLVARLLTATLHAPVTAAITAIPQFAARANAEVDRLIDGERNRDVDLYPDAGLVPKLLLSGSKHNLDTQTFCACAGSGDIAQLTRTVDATRSISLSVSEGLIRANLPTAESLTDDARQRSPIDVTITQVNYVFGNEGIDVDAEFDAEDTCWSIDGGTARQRMIPALAAQSVVFTPKPPRPEMGGRIELALLCELGLAAINLLEMAIDPNALLFEPTWAKTLGLSGSFTPPVTEDQPQPWSALAGVTWTQVLCSGEGLMLVGDLTGGGIVSPVQLPKIRLRSEPSPQNLHGVVQGTTTVQGPTCEPRVFDYVESIQDDRIALTVEQEFLFEPITYQWTLNGKVLTPSPKTKSLFDILTPIDYVGTVTTPLPPPNGTNIAGHAIRLQYWLGVARLELQARHEDLNYDIRVEVRAEDALGRVFTDAANLPMVGDIAQFGDDYDDYMDACVKAAAAIVNKKGRQRSKVKPGEPQQSWRDSVSEVVLQAREGNPEAVALIPSLKKTFGPMVMSSAVTGRVRQ